MVSEAPNKLTLYQSSATIFLKNLSTILYDWKVIRNHDLVMLWNLKENMANFVVSTEALGSSDN